MEFADRGGENILVNSYCLDQDKASPLSNFKLPLRSTLQQQAYGYNIYDVYDLSGAHPYYDSGIDLYYDDTTHFNNVLEITGAPDGRVVEVGTPLSQITVTNLAEASDITVALTEPGTAMLGGTLTVHSVSNGGTAAFSSLTIDVPGSYSLTFTHVESGAAIATGDFTVLDPVPMISHFWCSSTEREICSFDGDHLIISGFFFGQFEANIDVTTGVSSC